jgi:hypothetical protein
MSAAYHWVPKTGNNILGALGCEITTGTLCEAPFRRSLNLLQVASVKAYNVFDALKITYYEGLRNCALVLDGSGGVRYGLHAAGACRVDAWPRDATGAIGSSAIGAGTAASGTIGSDAGYGLLQARKSFGAGT